VPCGSLGRLHRTRQGERRDLTPFASDVINVFDDPIANAFIYTNIRTRYNQVFTPAIKAGISGRF
jgi:hypothetical protein